MWNRGSFPADHARRDLRNWLHPSAVLKFCTVSSMCPWTQRSWTHPIDLSRMARVLCWRELDNYRVCFEIGDNDHRVSVPHVRRRRHYSTLGMPAAACSLSAVEGQSGAKAGPRMNGPESAESQLGRRERRGRRWAVTRIAFREFVE
jgi:hypothetical protein